MRWPGERKQVTVLFADVVGSTALIRDRDPEDAQRLLDGAVQRMMDAVHQYEGTVGRLMGDGLMAMFGAPAAHEEPRPAGLLRGPGHCRWQTPAVRLRR